MCAAAGPAPPPLCSASCENCKRPRPGAEMAQNPWQSVIQTHMIGSGHVECAAVLRRRDGAVKATSLGYQPSPELVHAVTGAVRDPASARERGLQFNGASYTCVRADQWAIYGKKRSGGFIAIVSGQLIVFGSYSSAMSPCVCEETLEKMADYFSKKGK